MFFFGIEELSMRHAVLIVSCLLFCVAAGAAESPDPKASPSKSVAAPPEGQTPVGAGAALKPTQGNSVTGTLNLVAEKQGVRIGGMIEGLKAGSEQAFHIHSKGDCSAPDGSSAGDHFNPASQKHGDPKTPGPRHLGDMVNLKADASGVAKVDFLIEGATLHTGQPTDVLGKAIIVHQSKDDYISQPSGNAGARVACGVIK
jgi:superoxide dismutase, Cu-Zn family